MHLTAKKLETVVKDWLAKQPDLRTFNYLDVQDCVIATALKEELGLTRVFVGGVGRGTVAFNPETTATISLRLNSAVGGMRNGQAQPRYAKGITVAEVRRNLT